MFRHSGSGCQCTVAVAQCASPRRSSGVGGSEEADEGGCGAVGWPSGRLGAARLRSAHATTGDARELTSGSPASDSESPPPTVTVLSSG